MKRAKPIEVTEDKLNAAIERRRACERRGHHEYAMIYNDGTTCLDCGYHRPAGEESGEIRSISGVIVPSLLCDLARALPMPACPPEHELREAMTYCKACDESRDELQQMVGDGDLNSIAIVVGVYLRRLYAEYDRIGDALRDCFATPLADNETEVWKRFFVLDGIFGEVLSDEDRDIPTDDKAVRMVEETTGSTREQIVRAIRNNQPRGGKQK